jgi:signal transduction histidine kinase
MADASPSASPKPGPNERPEADVARAARRLFWPGGLSSRLLILTVLFVAVIGLLILPAALAQFEDRWLYDHVRAGELASLAIEAAPNQVVSDRLSRQLLNGAGVVSVAVQSGGVDRLVLEAPRMARTPYLVDLREGASPLSWSAPFQTLFGGKNRMVRVVARPSFRDGDFVEIVAPDAPLKLALQNYLLSLIGVALLFVVVVAGALYLLLIFFFVRPMQRITRSMERFRADPEDPDAAIHPSGRRDEIGRAEAELDRMQADLRTALNARARLAALGEAVAKINHDLRNMLTSAQIASERLAQSGDPKVAQAMPRLERALGRAVKLATGVLAYGKSDEPAPAPVAVRLAPAVEAAAEEVGLSPEGVHLDSQVDPRAQVSADPDQLHRILVNLMRNGREAIQSHSTDGGAGVISISLEQRDETSLIRIADNGPGVPERVQARMFQPFSGSGRPDGAGLGLAIARELAQAHGGDVVLVETGPMGTTFEVRLPGAPDPAATAPRRSKAAEPKGA